MKKALDLLDELGLDNGWVQEYQAKTATVLIFKKEQLFTPVRDKSLTGVNRLTGG